jgi:hypothetical protein
MMTWVFGKVDPGWYMACGAWNEEWARHLESQGYRVKRSGVKPLSNGCPGFDCTCVNNQEAA